LSVLIVEREGALTRLTLNRPNKRNALNLALADALLDAIAQAGQDGTRLLVVQGNGAGFCAGFDFSELDAASEADLLLQFVRIEQMLQALTHAPFDTLALAHGAAIGAGADLLVACRYRIGTDDVVARFPGARFGLMLGSRRLAQCVGAEAAQSLIGSADKTPADRLLGIGLLTEILASEQWPERVQRLLAQVCEVPATTRARVLNALRPDTRAMDMADLVATASPPDIKQRIEAYLRPPKV